MMQKIQTIFNLATLVLLAGFARAQASVGGNLTSIDTARCTAVNAGTITLGGHTGNIIRWEYSYSGGDPWTPMAVTSLSYNYSNLSQNTSFRAIVQVPSNLPATSGAITIRVYNPSNGGTITSASEVCAGQTTLLTSDGRTGNIQYWEESTTNGSTWNMIPASALATQLSRTISVPTQYRISVKNGACAAIYSAVVDIAASSASVAGTISGIDSVCISGNAVNLALSGYNGNSLSWEQSFAASGPWNPAAETTASLLRNNINQSTFYRVRVANGACPAVITATHRVHVSQPSFSGNLTGSSELCADADIALNLVNKNGAILDWEISADGGTNWNLLNHTNAILALSQPAGSYLFRTTVRNEVCPAAVTPDFGVVVHALPATDFTFSPACENQALAFVNTTPGQNLYVWDFGDNSSSNTAQPAHVFQPWGDYSVRLIATDHFGCTDSITHSVHVKANPVASFMVLSDTICNGDLVSFLSSSQLSEGAIASYTWTKANVGFSNASQTEQLFTQSGSIPIRLLVTSDLGCSDSIQQTITVHPEPVAAFTVANSCAGTASQFQNLSQIEYGTANYAWSFGDAGTSALTQAQHTYASAGSYITQLIVYSAYRCADTVSHPVVIHPVPVIDFTVNNTCLGDTAYYVSTVTNAASPAYSWQFGDGGQHFTAAPGHVFSGFGTYQSTLQVVSDSGCVATVSKNLLVHPVPVANFSIANACVNTLSEVVNYSQLASGTMQYDWDFGGVINSTDQHPQPVFNVPGTFAAQLIAVTDRGCRDTSTQNYTVFDQPQADFTFDNVCYGNTTHFQETSTVNFGTITGVRWDFGDNSNSTLADPVKIYLNEGDYTVTLIAEASTGCSDTAVSLVHVYEAPIANFSVNNTCLGEVAAFVNTSQLSLGVYTSFWQFGNMFTSDLFAPNQTFETPGVYGVQLTITSDHGCSDSIVKPVQVYAPPVVYAGLDATIDRGYTHLLQASGAAIYTWTPSDGLNAPQTANPLAQPQVTQTYIVSGEDQYGCIASDTVVITVKESFLLVPYNILTPDGNGQNDTWIVGNATTYPTNEVTVFNELGAVVYNQQAYMNDWDGRNATGELLPDGTYYYVITFSNADQVYKGDLLLIRNTH